MGHRSLSFALYYLLSTLHHHASTPLYNHSPPPLPSSFQKPPNSSLSLSLPKHPLSLSLWIFCLMESSCGSVRLRACLVEEDHGLASLAEMETIAAGYSGNYNHHQTKPHHHPFFSRRTTNYSTATSFRSISGASTTSLHNNNNNNSPRSGARFLSEGRFEEQPQAHFLEACALCRKPLGHNRDIFMYRGDTPFCSEECRQEQIERDESKEKNNKIHSLRKDNSNKSSSSTTTTTTPSKSHNYRFPTGTVAAA